MVKQIKLVGNKTKLTKKELDMLQELRQFYIKLDLIVNFEEQYNWAVCEGFASRFIKQQYKLYLQHKKKLQW